MTNLLSINMFSEKHPAFTKGGLRSLIFNADTNGLAQAGAVIRIGRKVLLNEAKFFEWVESLQVSAKGGQHA